MNRRYQVFLSSTYDDLKEERLEVIKALLELDCIPCGMEYFPAASEESWSYIKSLIDDCDYYVVIIGGRYGSLTQDGIGFTQKEYEYSLTELWSLTKLGEKKMFALRAVKKSAKK